jgi:hypothetical protein
LSLDGDIVNPILADRILLDGDTGIVTVTGVPNPDPFDAMTNWHDSTAQHFPPADIVALTAPCKTCDGRGYSLLDPEMPCFAEADCHEGFPTFTLRQECGECEGSGIEPGFHCAEHESCEGDGYINLGRWYVRRDDNGKALVLPIGDMETTGQGFIVQGDRFIPTLIVGGGRDQPPITLPPAAVPGDFAVLIARVP